MIADYPNMSHLEKKIKRSSFGVLLPINTSCSGTIERVRIFHTTHSFKKSSNLGCNSILPQSPQNTTLDRGFFAVGLEAVIGGAV
jgi:hypothetical protein